MPTKYREFFRTLLVNKTLSQSVHLSVVLSGVLEDFLCQACVSATMLLIVKGWLKWVKKETWSHSARFLVCK